MNCPTCISPTLADQQFCRSCGAQLINDRPRGVSRRVWGMVGLSLSFGGLMVAMTGKIIDVRWVTFAGVFIVLGGMFFIAALGLLGQSPPRRRTRRQTPSPETLAPVDTTNKLLPIGQNDFIPSVTEKTTDLLQTRPQTISGPIG